MEIKINGKTADITLDTEETIIEVITSLEQWITGSGHRLSGISLDGQPLNASMLDDIFSKDIKSVKTLDVFTSSIAQLTAESLFSLLQDIKEFENLKFEDKKDFFEDWKNRAQSVFISEQMPDLYNFFVNSFSGGEVSPNVVYSITEERLREVENPQQEFSNIQELVEETCSRLVDLPLDIQTGKETRAAQTIQIFSGITEKILRILRQLDNQKYLQENPFRETVNEFANKVKEFIDAYEKQDTVLTGDLAEYEIAPALKALYDNIKSTETTGLHK